MRLIEISANTGRTLRVLGVGFGTDEQVITFATEYLGLDIPDLDQSLIWQHPTRNTIIKTEG